MANSRRLAPEVTMGAVPMVFTGLATHQSGEDPGSGVRKWPRGSFPSALTRADVHHRGTGAF
ncbi:hypothetical protein [Thiohalomonas denitrificans]|uniref:hypothetical protein n=1 Tax=Thiohalomonas denitrificans TaxID=415747 RepID=UPI0026E9FA84|nr:hypothetical protein [Thiohalomonas denitrificans]